MIITQAGGKDIANVDDFSSSLRQGRRAGSA